ncbi:glycoside hydrolase 43 family protein [Salmonella enterica]|nr:glycosyl hydrolase 43 family protein [Salmonella enterica]EEY5654314.1 glycosyl hydrolase 43 family protein [Salmonella enterica]EIM8937952.1 glycoside hydrolase 43 family protein [Salmonella enterica]EIM9852071.1 glycoside hydrolase 43 family protein [Salmonella enterica]EIS0858402.1 glycoside hydrolase 43 family protein [Salmonella enterica]
MMNIAENPVWLADNNDGTYRNPVIYADYSDPDIVHVAGTYYMVASSFNHIPGIPVLESVDLVNWKLINHVVPRLPAPFFDSVQPGKGIWAPSIRYHGGYYWVFYSMPDHGIFMSKAKSPHEAWSTPHCLTTQKGWIDPCPFWDDDGSAWLVHAFAYSRSKIKHKLQLFQMSCDGKQLLDEGRIIFDGTCSHPTIEGPKCYKRNGLYYIFAPAGGVERGWQTVLRSESMTGPWIAKNILHQGNTPVNGPHQGGWVETSAGECWFMHFQDKGLFGRIVHLQPMQWSDDGWPRLGQTTENGVGEPVLRHPKMQGVSDVALSVPQMSDRFAQGKPGLQWQWLANPQKEWLSPTTQGLTLRCAPGGKRSLYDTPQLLLQKLPAPGFNVETKLQAQFIHDGDEAGLVIYGERFFALSVVCGKGEHYLKATCGWNSDDNVVAHHSRNIQILPDAPVELKTVVNEDGICHFYWRTVTEQWKCISETFAAAAGKWTGAKFGIYALSAKEHQQRGSALFEYVLVNK